MNAEFLLKQFDRISDAPDAVPRLRRFILDLAVRGKLVASDPAGEPVPELLDRIRSEKERLVKRGEIPKQKPVKPIENDEIPFTLAPNWCWVRLNHITSYIQRGKSPRYASNDGLPVISQKCVQWRGLDLESAKRITRESLATYEDIRFLREGDLLWNSTGTGTVGRIVRVTAPPCQLVCDSHVTVVRCLVVDPEYVRSWLRSDHVYGSIEDRAAGSTNQVELTSQMATNQIVPLPPIAEQCRIVAKIDELMLLCDRLEAAQRERETRRDRLSAAANYQLNDSANIQAPQSATFYLSNLPCLTKRIEDIKRLRGTIINLGVRGRLVPQDSNDEPAPSFGATGEPGKDRLDLALNDGWSWAAVDDVAEARLGKMLDQAQNSGKRFRYLRNTNVHWFDVRMDELKELKIEESEIDKYLLRRGDVLICEGGHGIGRTAVWCSDEGIVFQKALHRVRPGPALNSDFFSYCMFVYFHSRVLQTYFTGVGIPHFTGRALASLVFPLPPLPEQHRIVAKVDELMAVCDRLERQLSDSDAQSRGLLDAVLHNVLNDGHGKIDQIPAVFA